MKLTQDHRKRLFAGECPRLTGDGVSPVEPGDTYTLSQCLWLEVTDVRIRRGGGWSLAYTVHDHRDPARLVRRTPPVILEDFDSSYTIEGSREESSYTSASFSAVDGAGEAVPYETQKRQTAAAKETADRDHKRRRMDQRLLTQEARIRELQREAALKNINIRSETRLLEKLLAQRKPAEGQVRAIERKLDQHERRAA